MERSQLFEDLGVERVVDEEKSMYESPKVWKALELLKELLSGQCARYSRVGVGQVQSFRAL